MGPGILDHGLALSSSPTDRVRAEAVRHLERIESGGAYRSLIGIPDYMQPAARRRLTDLVAGVTRWRRWLDFLISQYSSRPVEQLDKPLRHVLRLAIFEMTQRSTPPHAIVNEYVELAGQLTRPQAKGFANAVLRTVSRSTGRLPMPTAEDEADRLGILQSHPTWMVRRWIDRYGQDETIRLLDWNNRPPSFGVRVNPLKTTVADVESRLDGAGMSWSRSRYLEGFLRVESVQPLTDLGLLREGAVHIQDESAGLVVRILDPQPGETVVDACAAPGGKLLYSCFLMQNRGRLVALDANERRLRAAESTARDAGCSIGEYSVADATNPPPEVAELQADRVLVDVPCSGLGVLSKRPDLRWRRSLTDIDHLTGLQDRLLDSMAGLVRPGGLLVYSTCTIEPDENQRRVEHFLRTHTEFRIEPVLALGRGEMVVPPGFFHSLPQHHGIDGAFAARLRRTG